MRVSKKTVRSLTMSALVGISLLGSLFLAAPAKALPPNSINIAGTECRFSIYRIQNGSVTSPSNAGGDSGFGYYVYNLPQEIIDTILDDPALEADYNYLVDNSDSNLNVILFDAVSPGDGTPQEECRLASSMLFSRPSQPRQFFGAVRGSNTLFRASLSADGTQIQVPSGSNRPPSSYNLGGDTALATGPAFSNGGGVGYCSTEQLVGGSVYSACMAASFQDFNTITYRGESYKLENWAGNDDQDLEYVLDLASSPYESRRTALASCSADLPYFRIANDGGGPVDELTLDGGTASGRIPGFFSELSNLNGNTGSHGIGFIDRDLLCNRIPPDGSTSVNVTNLNRLTRVAQYFPASQQITITAGGTSGTGDREGNLQQTFTQDGTNTRIFYAANVGDCSDASKRPSITFTDDPAGFNDSTGYAEATWFYPNTENSCANLSTVMSVKVTRSDSTETPETVGGGVTDGGSTENDPPEKTCSSEAGAVGWIVCPMLNMLDGAIVWLEERLAGFLFIDQAQFTTESGIYGAWSTLRGIATVIIVIIALIMIFSQAMGDGVFDNYSVKKLLPRLLIAGIGIQLSWFLLVQLVNIFNILGDGIAGIVLSPFKIGDESLTPTTKLSEVIAAAKPNADGISTGGQGLMAGIIIAGGFALVGAVIPLAIGAASALLVAFVTLIIRNMVVFLGIVFAPVAIAMSVLPGTQKTSKWWWESLEKALLMYPLVMALLASGKILAYVILQSGDPNEDIGGISTVAGIAAWYIPLFFVSKALEASGAIVGKAAGLTGDKTKGIFDKARSWDTDRKKKMGDIKTQQALSRGGIRGGWANFKSGNVGGIRSTTRATTRMARDQQRGDAMQKTAQVSAYEEYAEKRKLEGVKNASLVLDQAEVKVDQVSMNARAFDLAAAKAEMKVKEAEIATNQAAAAMSTSGIDIGNKAAVLAHYNAAAAGSAGDAQRTAALKQLAILGADGEIRQIQTSGTADQQRVVNENTSSSWFQSGLKDKAPDLTKGGAANAFGSVPVASKMHDWSDDTLRLALAHNGGQNVQEILDLAEKDPDFAASLDSKKRAVLEQAVHQASGGAAGTPVPAGLVNYAKKATS